MCFKISETKWIILMELWRFQLKEDSYLLRYPVAFPFRSHNMRKYLKSKTDTHLINLPNMQQQKIQRLS